MHKDLQAILILLGVALAIFISGCYYPPVVATSPCRDAKFLELKAKDINTLTDREYDYLKTKSAECDQFQLAALAQKNTSQIVDTWVAVTIAVLIIGVGGIVILSQ
jgi:hypothetical protein